MRVLFVLPFAVSAFLLPRPAGATACVTVVVAPGEPYEQRVGECAGTGPSRCNFHLTKPPLVFVEYCVPDSLGSDGLAVDEP